MATDKDWNVRFFITLRIQNPELQLKIWSKVSSDSQKDKRVFIGFQLAIYMYDIELALHSGTL